MTDDEYEGHTEGEWEWWNDYIRDTSGNEIAKMEYDYISADAQLIADAPKLLAEVKRLREGIYEVLNDCWPNATTMMKRLMELIK
mgnify:CR=1 FL=1